MVVVPMPSMGEFGGRGKKEKREEKRREEKRREEKEKRREEKCNNDVLSKSHHNRSFKDSFCS